MTKNELTINNWVRHRDQGEKPYRITSITIDGDKYLYTAMGLTADDVFIDVRAATFEPIAITEVILKACGYVQMIDPNNVIRAEKYFSINNGIGSGSLIEINRNGQFAITMSGGNGSFLTKKVKYLHELQNLCKAFDTSIINVDWSYTDETDSTINIDDEDAIPMW